MKYPKFLKDFDTIGAIATSCGNNVNPYRARAMESFKYFERNGYTIKRAHRLFRTVNCVSGPDKLRADDFMSFYKNKNVDFIWSTGGGEIMVGMLPYVDFDKLAKLPPKYFMGYSDNTNLTFTLTTLCDVATIYGLHITAFGRNGLAIDSIDNLKLARGEKLEFESYPYYQGELSKVENPGILDKVIYKDESLYKSLSGENLDFSGRIIGGCIDVLITLCGTKYDKVKDFADKYKKDGIIWYFDVCDLSSVGLYRALFQLKENGWFKNAKGFIIGRPRMFYATVMGYSFEQAMIDILKDLNVPIITNSDFSHISPLMPVINGSICNIKYNNGKANISYTLK